MKTKGLQLELVGAVGWRYLSAFCSDPGEHASTVTTSADILSYSRTRGLFAGTNLDGSAITEDEDEARTLYGSKVPSRDIPAGKTQAASTRGGFVSEVAKYADQPTQRQ